MAIENPIVSPWNSGKPPKKYCVRSQFGVTKNFIHQRLKACANELMSDEPIEPNNVMAIANAEFVNMVLSENAKVNNKT